MNDTALERAIPGIPTEITLVEVGLRDGLQTVREPISTEVKVSLIHDLIDAGVREIEAVSFAHPKVLPQFSDAAEVLERAPRVPGVRYRGLVPNARGAERAAALPLDIMVALATTDEAVTHRNQNTTVAAVLAGLSDIGQVARAAQQELIVGVANSFFAWGSGVTPRSARLRAVEAAANAGASGVYLACTTGMEDPRQVYNGVSEVRELFPHLQVGVHLHARNGMALASAITAMQAGATWLEGSFGGLGGDLWAPGDPRVLGNAPFEDIVHVMDDLGVATGIDLRRYLKIVHRVTEITGWESTASVVSGGTRSDLIRENVFDKSDGGAENEHRC